MNDSMKHNGLQNGADGKENSAWQVESMGEVRKLRDFEDQIAKAIKTNSKQRYVGFSQGDHKRICGSLGWSGREGWWKRISMLGR